MFDLCFDVPGCFLYQGESVRMHILIVAGEIDAADDLTVRVVDGRGGTGPGMVRDAVVFRPGHLDGHVVIQRDADGVSADFQVAPHGAGNKAHVAAAGDHLRRAEDLQQVPGAVGQHDQELCAVDELEHLMHDGHGDVQKQTVFFPGAGQDFIVDMPAFAPCGIHAGRLTLFPRFGNGRADLRTQLVLENKLRPDLCQFSKIHFRLLLPSSGRRPPPA